MSGAITAAVVGGGALIYSAKEGKKAAGKVADATNAASADQAAIAQQQLDMSKEQWNYYKQNYQPLEQDMLGEVNGYTMVPDPQPSSFNRPAANTPNSGRGLGAIPGLASTMLDKVEKVNKSGPYAMKKVPVERKDYGLDPRVTNAVDRAVNDVNSSYSRARTNSNRELSRYGIDPTSSRYAGLNRELDMAQGAASAGAKTRTRQDTSRFYEGQDWDKKRQMLSLGKGLPTQAGAMMSSAANTSANAGNFAINSARVGVDQANSNAQFLGQMTGLGLNYANKAGWFDTKPAATQTGLPTSSPSGSTWI